MSHVYLDAVLKVVRQAEDDAAAAGELGAEIRLRDLQRQLVEQFGRRVREPVPLDLLTAAASRQELMEAIERGLKQCLHAHGPIHKWLVTSAAKRVKGRLEHLALRKRQRREAP